MGFKVRGDYKANKREEIVGIFQCVTYANNGFFIGKIFSNNNLLTIKGNANADDFLIGVEYRFGGAFNDDSKYGRQFCFDSFAIPEPVSAEAIMRYLRQFDGIGATRARAIVMEFGEQSINRIRQAPEEVAQRSGVKEQILISAAQKLDNMTLQEQVRLELMSLLDGKGFPKSTVNHLIKDYDQKAACVVRSNPFVMTKYKGIGFELCDQVWKSLNLPLNDPIRKREYILFLIDSDSTGSTWFDLSSLMSRYNEKFNEGSCECADVVEKDFQVQIMELQNQGVLSDCREGYIARQFNADLEESIQHELTRLMDSPHGMPFEVNQETLSSHQYAEAQKALSQNVGILIGSPGTGKTFTAATILKSVPSDRVAVCAPTGKAALRMGESMAQCGVEIEARTIHSLLEAVYTSDGFGFARDQYNPIDADFVVVDESSMIDNYLMEKLLKACWNGTRVLFVGDPHQLPPVGKGAPLRDFITMHVPTGCLTEIRRNSGAIVEACANIKSGEPFPFLSFPPTLEKNLVYTYNTPAAINIVKLLDKLNDQEKKCENLQVIVALNEHGDCSRASLNKILQNYYNRSAEPSDRRWKVGDKVICLTNGIAETAEGEKQGPVRVSNGDIGFVRKINQKNTWVELGDRLVIVPRSSDKWNESDWDLGYAITCHKSQGSEWESVIVVLDPAGCLSICDRHWIYTAISRAKKYCYLVGSKETAQRMINRTTLWKRITGFYLEYLKSNSAFKTVEEEKP